MKVNWCAGCGRGSNFGDQLGPLLLRAFGIEPVWAAPADAELITVGSILSKVPDGWRGTVLGSGFIRAGMTKDLRRARVLALRGTLTRGATRLRATPVLADPGILAPRLWVPAHGDGLAIVPHYVDHELAKRYPHARVVDITAPPADVVAGITGASRIITSSLHGLITADAYGIPHSVEPHEDVIGGLFKFRDYVSAFGEKIRVGRTRLTSRAAMEARQRELADVFASLRGTAA